MKIVFLDADTLGNVSLESIRGIGDLSVYGRSTAEEAKERITDAEVLIVNKVRVTDELMSMAPALRLICEAATGTDNIDSDAAQKRGITVKNVAAYSTDSVAQLTFTQILNLVVRPGRYDSYVKNGKYMQSGLFTEVSDPYTELSGKTIGIIGMGRIGNKVATIATAFGMNVIYYSTSGTSHCSEYPSVDIDTLLTDSDVVSIHCPLNDRTRGLICMSQLERMKPTAYIVNMARGGIVDEKALFKALDEGVIAGAALDVFSAEPVSPPEMLHPERLLLSPHVAWTSREALSRLVDGIAKNISSFINSASQSASLNVIR